MEIKLRIILQNPPPGVNFALQKGVGNNYQIEQMQTAGSGNLIFQFPVTLRSIAVIDFAGPFVQGPKNRRFIYISIGKRAGQFNSPWDRRLKVPLTGIDHIMLKNISEETLIETLVPGTAKDDGPNCATVKPFAGWALAKS